MLARLDTARCPSGGDLGNLDGRLDCGAAPGASWTSSYRQSCGPCTLSGAVLSCDCKGMHDGERSGASSLDVAGCPPGSDIANVDGWLACQAGAPLAPPGGSYLQSCDPASCSLAGRVLRCACKTRSGSTERSTLDLSICPPGDIANLDGRLSCSQ